MGRGAERRKKCKMAPEISFSEKFTKLPPECWFLVKMQFLRENVGFARPGAKTTVIRMVFAWFLRCLFAKKWDFLSFLAKTRKFREFPGFWWKFRLFRSNPVFRAGTPKNHWFRIGFTSPGARWAEKSHFDEKVHLFMKICDFWGKGVISCKKTCF